MATIKAENDDPVPGKNEEGGGDVKEGEGVDPASVDKEDTKPAAGDTAITGTNGEGTAPIADGEGSIAGPDKATASAVAAKPSSKERESASKKESQPIKIIPAVPLPEPEPDPNVPSERDVCVGVDHHRGTMLLHDLIRIHFFLWKKKKQEGLDSEKVETKEAGVMEIPTDEKDVEDLASRLTSLLLNGKKFELSGLKDVPKPFLKRQGRFFEKKEGEDGWNRLDEDGAKSYVARSILALFKELSEEAPSTEVKECVDVLFANAQPKSGDEPYAAPRACDVLFLPVESPWEENMAYEHQSGNKHLLFLASQNVSSDTKESSKRVEAAFKLITSKVEVHSGTDTVQKYPRFVVQRVQEDNQNSWCGMEIDDLAEFAVVFVFEVYLEKQIHGTTNGITNVSVSAQVANMVSDTAKPSDTPIEAPTTHDVLFGRGGMTNGHPGNRRFRDIIALHRPDYINASKMDKPNVARRIVRAIRQGNPSGRFLKKHDDGMWRDVGDKVAAEKTSQGLRERSNVEKRQRSALREALRIRREDMTEGGDGVGEPASKKIKAEAAAKAGSVSLGAGDASLDYTGVIPLSLSMKDKGKDNAKNGSAKKSRKGSTMREESTPTESLPPNAVDEEGNILVTDYDILCGRGGLTNHHRGNKRFRDIVALHRPDYVRAPKIQKPSVARVIVRAIRNGDPPGRFLKKDEKTGKWIDIGDKKAAEKTSQALREKTNEEKGGGAVPAGFTSPTMVLPAATAATTEKEKGVEMEEEVVPKEVAQKEDEQNEVNGESGENKMLVEDDSKEEGEASVEV